MHRGTFASLRPVVADLRLQNLWQIYLLLGN